MKNISKIFKVCFVVTLFSIKIVASGMPEYLANKKTLCLSALCLVSSAGTIGGSVLTAQSIATCLQVAPVGECLVGAGVACACAYITVGAASELRYHNPDFCSCCRFGKKTARIGVAGSAGLMQAPVQQIMGQAPDTGAKLE